MLKNKLSVVILAAGNGKRMYSNLPKVLHTLAGKPIVQYVIDTAIKLNANNIYFVYGHNSELLKNTLSTFNLHWVFQSEQLGTGHAMKQVSSYFSDNEDILVLYGDVPLISINTLTKLIKEKPEDGIGLLTTTLNNPNGYGRIIRKNGHVIGIVENYDFTFEKYQVNEVNTGILIANGYDLKRWLNMIKNNNIYKEYYFTDIISLAYSDGKKIKTIHVENSNEVKGINNCFQLSEAEAEFQLTESKKLLLSGVTLLHPKSFSLRGKIFYGQDISIDSNVILEGIVKLGNQVIISTGCILKNCNIGNNCKINAYSILEDIVISDNCVVGPFAHLRPGTKLDKNVKIGNFVEIKKTNLGTGSKISHFSYLGDSDIGSNVNIGAGTITCNYDGLNKHNTIIHDNVFVGASAKLIAPVSIGKGSTIAAGTTVTCDVNENELVLSRIKQQHIKGWLRPEKKTFNNKK
ncbi:Bifunctional protein GlmU [Serratia symbiotica]|nr:Bifunctional protein GlmU [Serratia symbiotica]